MLEKLRNNKKYMIIAAIILAAAAGGGGYYAYQRHEQAVAAATLTLYGNADVREVSLAFRQSDRIADILVEEGDHVKKDQVLARLDTDELHIQQDKLKAQIDAQQSVVDKLHNGTRPQEIAEAKAKADAADSASALAQQNLDRAEDAYNSSGGRSVSKTDLDAARTKVQVTAADAQAAHQAYDLAVAGPRQEDVAAGESQLNALKEEQNRLSYIEDQSELKAPADGIIRSRLLQPGDMASPQKPVFKMSLTDKKWIRVYVSEKDLSRVYEGQAAKIYIDSDPKHPLTGQIGYIASTAEFTPKTVQTTDLRSSLLYEVRVYFNDPNNVIRMGMPATVKIDTRKAKNG